MAWLDYGLLIIIALSALLGLFRGIVREVLSLVGWALSFWVALKFSQNFQDLLVGYISSANLRYGVVFLSLFLSVLVISMLINRLVSKLIRLSGLGGVDRIVGTAFGAVRGIIVVAILVMIGGITPLATEPVWAQSIMVGKMEGVTTWASDIVPRNIVQRQGADKQEEADD